MWAPRGFIFRRFTDTNVYVYDDDDVMQEFAEKTGSIHVEMRNVEGNEN